MLSKIKLALLNQHDSHFIVFLIPKFSPISWQFVRGCFREVLLLHSINQPAIISHFRMTHALFHDHLIYMLFLNETFRIQIVDAITTQFIYFFHPIALKFQPIFILVHFYATYDYRYQITILGDFFLQTQAQNSHFLTSIATRFLIFLSTISIHSIEQFLGLF